MRSNFLRFPSLARGVAPDTDISADVCIVGGGAAGIAIALQLTDTRLNVVLLESGGLASDAATQSLYAGENVGLNHVPLDTRAAAFWAVAPTAGADGAALWIRSTSKRAPGCRAVAGR